MYRGEYFEAIKVNEQILIDALRLIFIYTYIYMCGRKNVSDYAYKYI